MPGTTRRTSDGCPPDQTRTVRCGARCGYSEEVEPCSSARPVDVIFLLDVTGSNAPSIAETFATFRSRCIERLLSMDDVLVGISYMGEFPIAPYGASSDRPFEGGIEPTSSLLDIVAELDSRPSFNGQDINDATVEALSSLSGGPLATSSVPLLCSVDRIAGGCWRPDAVRVIVVDTNSPIHNGPDPSSDGLLTPYRGIDPAPAAWPDVQARMTADQTVLWFFDRQSTPSTAAQFGEMLSDLGLPSSYRSTVSRDTLGRACEQLATEVRTFANR